MGIASFFSPFHVGSQRRVKPCGLYISKRDDLFANNNFISLSNRMPQLFPVEIPTNGRLPNPPFILAMPLFPLPKKPSIHCKFISANNQFSDSGRPIRIPLTSWYFV